MLARAVVLSSLVFSSAHVLPRASRVVLPRVTSIAMRKGGSSSKQSAVRNPNNLPVKTCVVCNRPFTWRKKWEDCWDEVTCCSKRCNGERKKANRVARGAQMAAGDFSDDDDVAVLSDASSSGGDETIDEAKAARKAARKAAKAERRAKREGTLPGVGQKPCDVCERKVDLLVRCQVDAKGTWTMVCGRCWKTPAVAGGVVDGSGDNPHYRYGGLWKNLHRTVPG